ncbi:E1-like protein-activating enzyme gsa7p/apg7p, partial [Globisporangium splendens]
MATSSDDGEWHVLKFQPWNSAPDVTFWQKLAALKLNTFQLNDQAQDFKNLDKAAVLQQAGEKILGLVVGDSSNVESLNSFVLVTFADLKKHSFLYWFGFPALTPAAPYKSKAPAPVSSALPTKEQAEVVRGLLELRRESGEGFSAFFVIERLTEVDTGGNVVRVQSLQSWKETAESTQEITETIFGFVDPCPLKTNPGWPLRNYLAFLSALPESKVPRDQPLKILALREHLHHISDVPDDFECNTSLIFEVKNEPFLPNGRSKTDVRMMGWEANARGKLGPRIMELGGILDPIRLAETSVDLNLKLMRWRQLPSLDLEKIAQTKCLLLGAGTLGCYTARSLLSWGFRHITFVDNSTVSHSNPVRQPLFEFQDCGKPKGECAANALKRIFPLVNSKAVNLTIPMAGHALSNDQLIDEAKRGLDTLEQLIDEHDAIFLGTDSRESRWLPTVIAASKKKLLLNAALGFDSYLVMRHGVQGSNPDEKKPTTLGCYFCNDIVSPRDSLKDRTLDQMCTVTRPGLAPIASATAVELLVAVLHSPDGKYASAEKSADGSAPMGFIPHQLRGFLNAFNSMVITGESFDKCIACSTKVLAAYEANAFQLLENACNSSSYLEELTGLSQLTQEVDNLSFELDDSDDDSELI